MSTAAARVRPVSQGERLTTVEGRVDQHQTRLDRHEKMFEPAVAKIDEIHQILVAARALAWLVRRIVVWGGGPGAVGALAYAAWKVISGH